MTAEAHNVNNWAYFVKYELTRLGFGELWINQYIGPKHLLLDQTQHVIRGQIYQNLPITNTLLMAMHVVCGIT